MTTDLTEIIDLAADRAPDMPALAGETRILDYRTLRARVAQLAGAIRKAGINPGDRVAIIDNNSVEYAEVYYAALRAGTVLVPINSRLSPSEVQNILQVTETSLVFLGKSHNSYQSSVENAIGSLGILVSLGPEGASDYAHFLQSGEPLAPHKVQGGDTIQIFFTSGSTGEPKGVCLTANNLAMSAVDAIATMKLARGDVWLHAAPMFHLVDAWAIWALPMLDGLQIAFHFNPEAFFTLTERYQATATGLPPTLISMCARHPAGRAADISSLKRITYGGSPITEAALAEAQRFFGCELVQSYGLTEASGITTIESEGGTGTAGRAVPNVQLRITRQGSVVRPGDVGEVELAGPRITPGYWRAPERTAEAFADGWFQTGDVGSLDEEARLTLLGRSKDMIISGGENVYPAEVENRLASHPQVLEVAVVGVPDPKWGEAVVAIVVPRPEMTPDPEQLAAYCRERLAGYKVPKRFIIEKASLPRTGTGKFDKRGISAAILASAINSEKVS